MDRPKNLRKSVDTNCHLEHNSLRLSVIVKQFFYTFVSSKTISNFVFKIIVFKKYEKKQFSYSEKLI